MSYSIIALLLNCLATQNNAEREDAFPNGFAGKKGQGDKADRCQIDNIRITFPSVDHYFSIQSNIRFGLFSCFEEIRFGFIEFFVVVVVGAHKVRMKSICHYWKSSIE